MTTRLPLPQHFEPAQAGSVWRVQYQLLSTLARDWAKKHGIRPAWDDVKRVLLLLVDAQNTFCIPDYELFVAGRSGRGAMEDNARLAAFIYRNLGMITEIGYTLDTHRAIHVAHEIFWVNRHGQHPKPGTVITLEDVIEKRWMVNRLIAATLKRDLAYLDAYALHYVRKLTEGGKHPLLIWPYHGQLRGIGHAMVSILDEALFFHEIARSTEGPFALKGLNRMTEFYSAIGPEVRTDQLGTLVVNESGIAQFEEDIYSADAVIVAGQAKSHCVPATVLSLVERRPAFARKLYLLDDCSSPVVIPGVVDFTEAAETKYREFAAAGAHLVRSTDPIDTWPDFPLA